MLLLDFTGKFFEAQGEKTARGAKALLRRSLHGQTAGRYACRRGGATPRPSRGWAIGGMATSAA
eukprot:7287700-Pyramimonas_sp.AAC.1